MAVTAIAVCSKPLVKPVTPASAAPAPLTNLPKASSVKEAVVMGNPDEIAVTNSATLRETLSRMLGQGLKSIPVIDDNGHFVGEVALSNIEAATAETEA